RQSRGTAADDHDIDIERFAFDARELCHRLNLVPKSRGHCSGYELPVTGNLIPVEAAVAIAILFLASAVTSFVATRIVKGAAEHIGLVDRPDERKQHERDIPRVGGLAIIFGF